MAKCDVPRFITSNVTWHGKGTGPRKTFGSFASFILKNYYY
jgi:hypothetical protein